MSSTINVGNRKILFAIPLAAVLIGAFVLIPMSQTEAQVETEGIAACINTFEPIDDPIAMNTVVVGKRVRTVHVEKELFHCAIPLGTISEIVIFTKIFEDLVPPGKIISQKFSGFLCVKDMDTGEIRTDKYCNFFPVRTYDDVVAELGDINICRPNFDIRNPVEVNTVAAGSGNPAVIKTVYAEKEVFDCFTTPTSGNRCGPISIGPCPVKLEVITFAEEFEHNVTGATIKQVAFAAVCIKGIEGFFSPDETDWIDRIGCEFRGPPLPIDNFA